MSVSRLPKTPGVSRPSSREANHSDSLSGSSETTSIVSSDSYSPVSDKAPATPTPSSRSFAEKLASNFGPQSQIPSAPDDHAFFNLDELESGLAVEEGQKDILEKIETVGQKSELEPADIDFLMETSQHADLPFVRDEAFQVLLNVSEILGEGRRDQVLQNALRDEDVQINEKALDFIRSQGLLFSFKTDLGELSQRLSGSGEPYEASIGARIQTLLS